MNVFEYFTKLVWTYSKDFITYFRALKTAEKLLSASISVFLGGG